MSTLTSHPNVRTFLLCLGGVGFGALASLMNGPNQPVTIFLSQYFGLGWSWAALGFVSAMLVSGTWLRAAVTCAATLASAVVSYELVNGLRGVAVHTNFSRANQIGAQATYVDMWTLVGPGLVWIVCGLLATPILTQAARWLDASGWRRFVGAALIPVLALFEATNRLIRELNFLPRMPVVAGLVTIDVLAAIALLRVSLRLVRQLREASR